LGLRTAKLVLKVCTALRRLGVVNGWLSLI